MKSKTARSTAKKPLKEYAAKRDFTKSPEPGPVVKKRSHRGDPYFCVQKHLASHLHYDFRLEHNGVLLSWAVPKGPSLNPADKRMAVHVEDHPLDYGSFEGVIPSGYGAGIVMLWDKGMWTPESDDVDAALKQGELKFRLDGVKLKGSWVLVRTRRPAGGREQWLLIKHRDKWSGAIDVTTAAPQSVKSFGDLPDIAAANDEVVEWRGSPPVKGGETGKLFAEVLRSAQAIRRGERDGVKVTKAVWESNRGSGNDRVKRRQSKAKTQATVNALSRPKRLARSLSTSSHQVKLSNPTKVLFPKVGFTKQGLFDYYTRIAPHMLPHLIGKAATLKRYPDGVEGEFFFEKRCNAYRPKFVKTIRVEGKNPGDKTIDFCDIADLPSLQWAAQVAAIEIHVPLALGRRPDTPLTMVFDLDPGAPATIVDCVPVALRLRAMLEEVGLKSVVKTSGGKGLHLLVPLNNPNLTFDDTKAFARAVAMTLEKDDPKRVISQMSRAARPGKVFIDWSQNDRNKTTVCVFSVRAREEPTISWPLDWKQLKSPKPLRSPSAADRTLPKIPAAWVTTLGLKQSLPD